MSELSQNISDISPKKLALLSKLLREKGQNTLKTQVITPRKSELNYYPLSFSQRRLWFLSQLEEGSDAYNMPAALQLTGTIEITALEQTLREIVRRHEVLRTNFVAINGAPVQVINPARAMTLPLVNLQALPEVEQSTEVQRLAIAEGQRPFDLTKDPLLRVTLLRLNEKFHVLLVTMHHIISDGWSIGIFIQEFSILYKAFSKGAPSPLPDLPIQYADFACWQHQWLQTEVLETNLSYWKKQLANIPILELPTNRPRPAVQSFRGTRQFLHLPKTLTEELKALSHREQVTLFITMLTVFQILLHYYTGQNDIVVGTDVANRNHTDIEKVIGFFVNQLVLRTNLSGNPTFQELLTQTREVSLEAYTHQDLPFDKLVGALNLKRDISRTPLFQIKFVLQNTPISALEFSELNVSFLEVNYGTTKLDLLLDMEETEQGLVGALEYNTDLFEASTIARLLEHFEMLLHSVVTQPLNTRLNALEQILAEADRQKQLIKDKKLEEATAQKLNKAKRKSI
ncbi:condensation domain-containing protein [Dulcicalothrix desertica]|nr:condensation domain-containing protein [Dulcicalothrix desertica]TWH43972.1 Non-ribosomal peptide synthetase modules and related proteins [Dulcicalothrix desertica PCC 7102]